MTKLFGIKISTLAVLLLSSSSIAFGQKAKLKVAAKDTTAVEKPKAEEKDTKDKNLKSIVRS